MTETTRSYSIGARSVKPGVELHRSRGGWGGVHRANQTRTIAITVNGQALRTAAGAVRTFATWETAEKVARAI